MKRLILAFCIVFLLAVSAFPAYATSDKNVIVETSSSEIVAYNTPNQQQDEDSVDFLQILETFFKSVSTYVSIVGIVLLGLYVLIFKKDMPIIFKTLYPLILLILISVSRICLHFSCNDLLITIFITVIFIVAYILLIHFWEKSQITNQENIVSSDQIEKGEAEQAIIRAMILMKRHDNEEVIKCDLRPPELKKYYVNLENAEKEEYDSWISELQSYQDKIKKYLDWLNVDDNIDSLKIKATYVFTFSIFFAYSENLSHETLKVLWEELRNTTASTIIGAGADYSASKVERYLNYIKKLI